MKIDFMNSLYIFLCISFFIIAISYVKFSISKLKNELLREKIYKNDIGKVIQFLKKLIIEDYMSYEKYEIWRFCVENGCVKVML